MLRNRLSAVAYVSPEVMWSACTLLVALLLVALLLCHAVPDPYSLCAHRDEVKKLNREKAQLAERLKEAEGAQLRLDGEMSSLRASAGASTERHDAVLADSERKLHKAQDLAQTRQDEVTYAVDVKYWSALLTLQQAFRM